MSRRWLWVLLISLMVTAPLAAYERPYGPNAPWNIPVAGLPHHPDEDIYSYRLWDDGNPNLRAGNFNLVFDQYTYPVYSTLDATGNYIVDSYWPTNIDGTYIPWNPDWDAAGGTDAQVILLDPCNGYEYNLWQVSFDGTTIDVTNGNLVQNGTDKGDGSDPADYRTKENGFSPSRGCGIQYLAMLVRPEEVAAGVIQHALSMPIPNTHGSEYVAPATKLEHSHSDPNCIPEGTRFYLDITEADIDAWVASLPAELPEATRQSGRVIARALRDYGFFVTDTTYGSPFLQFEDYITAGDEWTALGLDTHAIGWSEYPRDLLDGLFTEEDIRAVVPSDQYPVVDDTAPPTVPQGVSLDSLDYDQATLSWQPSSDDNWVYGYRVFRNGGSVGTTGNTSYTDTTVGCCSSYSYTVSAYDTSGNESAQSAEVTGTTGPEPQTADLSPDGVVDLADLVVMAGSWLGSGCGVAGDLDASGLVDFIDYTMLFASWTRPDYSPPTVPTGLTISAVTGTSLGISWTPSDDNVDVAGYRVFRDGGSIGTTATAGYTDQGLSPETVYSYAVSAFDTADPVNESGQSATLVATTGPAGTLVAHWPFETGTGGTAYDVSGNGHDATIAGAGWDTGYSGNGLYFDGSNDCVKMGTLDVAGITGGITIAAWVRPSNFGSTTDHRVMTKADGPDEQDHDWSLATDSGSNHRPRLRVKTGTTTTTLIATSGDLVEDAWTHLAATYNGSTMELWKDGDSIGSVAKTGTLATDATTEAWVGAHPDNHSGFIGDIDEVTLFDYGLSETEVEALMTP